MQITLDQAEIELAIQQFVQSNFNFLAGQHVGIEFTAGRGTNGLTAALNISAAKAVLPGSLNPRSAQAMPLKRHAAATVAATTPTPAEPEAVEEAAPASTDESPDETYEEQASISTGEERVDPAQIGEVVAEEPEAPAPKVNPFKKPSAPVAETAEEAAPADAEPKPSRSIFSKAG